MISNTRDKMNGARSCSNKKQCALNECDVVQLFLMFFVGGKLINEIKQRVKTFMSRFIELALRLLFVYKIVYVRPDKRRNVLAFCACSVE